MQPELEQFVNDLKYWTENIHDGYVTTKVDAETDVSCHMSIYDEEDEECHIGNFADSGIHIQWLGRCTVADCNLVKVNGITMEAIGKCVAAWVFGYCSF